MLRVRVSIAALFLLTAVGFTQSGCSPRHPNVLVIVVDTLRADHLSFYGYPRAISPNIDQLALDSVVFSDAMSHVPLTVPSILQLMTGRYLLDATIPEKTATLAEIFSSRGYQTMAVIENPVLELRRTGVARGFDEVFINPVLDERLEQQHAKTGTPADVITRRAIRWLADHDSRRPFFVWLHYFDPHDPYAPPYSDGLPFDVASGSKWTGDVRRLGISREQTPSSPAPRVRDPDRQRLVDLYDAEIHYLDQSLGDLIRDLESNGLYDDTLIVFTSDHAEAFGEHGFWTHGHSLHQSQIHVPLLIKLPQPHTRHEVRPDPVGLADLMTTLCGYLEFDCPSRETATNLLDDPPSVVHALWRTQVVAREGRWKLIHDELSGASQLFDLAADPDERHDIKKREPEIVTRLRTGKDRWLRATWPSYEQAIQQSRQQYRQLQALGYLE